MTPTDDEQPLYVRIAEGLKQQIEAGTLPEGSRLPSEQKLAQTWSAGRPTVRQALDVLRREGFLTTQPNRGTFVRRKPAVEIRSSTRYQRRPPGEETSPFAVDARREGARPDWTWDTQRVRVQDEIAERLGITPGDYAMCTRYLYRASGAPVQMSTSWEPYALVAGTEIEEPEAESKTTGVIARMDTIGVHIDRVTELVQARAATTRERHDLAIAADTVVMTIARTHWAGASAVETCDIVIPADRYALQYEIPIG
jgi:DNA-binding GntR family transcriptional regulator